MDKVFEHRPTIVTLTFGMNDVGYMDFTLPGNDTIGERNVKTSLNHYQQMEKILKKQPRVKKILIGSSPYDETSKLNKVPFPGKNNLIADISDYLAKRAADNQWYFIDFNRPMVAINQREQQFDSTFTLCGRDRIHPSTDGHLVMAYLFLRAQGLAGNPVADISIYAAGKAITHAVNCTVSDLSVSAQNICFTYLAKSLPFPIDSSYYDNELHNQADGLKVIPFMEELSRVTRWILLAKNWRKGDCPFYGIPVKTGNQPGFLWKYPAIRESTENSQVERAALVDGKGNERVLLDGISFDA